MATKAQYQAAAEKLEKLDAVADAQGTIQADAMVSLFPGRPERHTTTQYKQAARWLGLEQDEDGEWYAPAAKYDVVIEGEGHSTTVEAASAEEAAEKAEKWVRGGDYDKGQTVTYWVTAEGEEQGDSREVVIGR